MKASIEITYLSNYSYFAHHVPSGEDWYLLGIDEKGDKVCAAGWPATIGKLSDCIDLQPNKPLDEDEIDYRNRQFGHGWI